MLSVCRVFETRVVIGIGEFGSTSQQGPRKRLLHVVQFAAQVLDLNSRGLDPVSPASRHLAYFEEFLRPIVIEALGNTLLAA